MPDDDDLLEICDMPGLKIPEIRLWAACLKRCLQDLKLNPSDETAIYWIFFDNDIFLSFAEVLGTDPDYLRHKVRKRLKTHTYPLP